MLRSRSSSAERHGAPELAPKGITQVSGLMKPSPIVPAKLARVGRAGEGQHQIGPVRHAPDVQRLAEVDGLPRRPADRLQVEHPAQAQGGVHREAHDGGAGLHRPALQQALAATAGSLMFCSTLRMRARVQGPTARGRTWRRGGSTASSSFKLKSRMRRLVASKGSPGGGAVRPAAVACGRLAGRHRRTAARRRGRARARGRRRRSMERESPAGEACILARGPRRQWQARRGRRRWRRRA